MKIFDDDWKQWRPKGWNKLNWFPMKGRKERFFFLPKSTIHTAKRGTQKHFLPWRKWGKIEISYKEIIQRLQACSSFLWNKNWTGGKPCHLKWALETLCRCQWNKDWCHRWSAYPLPTSAGVSTYWFTNATFTGRIVSVLLPKPENSVKASWVAMRKNGFIQQFKCWLKKEIVSSKSNMCILYCSWKKNTTQQNCLQLRYIGS